jgi:hypothetical protein
MNAVTNGEESEALKDVLETSEAALHAEAGKRLAEIISHLQPDLQPYLHYEIQELKEGKTVSPEDSVIDLPDLKKILYGSSLEKKEIRRIIASIRHRARAVQARSEAKARERQKGLRKS